jgi:hypothetical protein
LLFRCANSLSFAGDNSTIATIIAPLFPTLGRFFRRNKVYSASLLRPRQFKNRPFQAPIAPPWLVLK